MKKVLMVHSSPILENSVSRTLMHEFRGALGDASSSVELVERDLATTPVPHLSATTIGAFFTPPDQRSEEQAEALAISDELVDEFLDADVVAIGVPMYNFGIPSGVKAYIDHIVRAGKTFQYGAEGPKGLVTDKAMLFLTARGGVYAAGTPNHQNDHQEGYLRSIFGFVGVDDLTFIHCEGVATGSRDESIAQAKERVVAAANRYGE